jgi:hypothetical protein
MNRSLRSAAMIAACLVLAIPAAAEFVISEPSDGRVSPAYALNSTPPRPVLTPPEAIPADLTEGAYLIVNTDNLFMRQGDAPEFAPVAILDGGTALIPLGTNGDDPLWWYVQVGGERGWVKDEFVVLRGDARGLPEVEATGTLTLPRLYTGGENFIRTAPLYLRNYICLFPGDLEYEVIGRTSDSDWLEIRGTCDTGALVEGWIPADNGLLRNPAGVAIPVTY